MKKDNIVIIIPLNDPEAVLISQIAQAMGLDLIASKQGHGASADKSKGLIEKIKKGGWKEAIIIEMPGLKTEKMLKKLGVKVVIIDHHNYTGLKRAFEKGRIKQSSLEQFIKLFKLGDKKLKDLGFDFELVKGIGVMDRGFVWQALQEGYDWREIKKIMDYQDELMAQVRDMKDEKLKIKAAEEAWKNREKWGEFYIMQNKTNIGFRARLSRLIAYEMKKPTPLILVEPKRHFIYVQETDKAQELFKKFGGFTFGMGTNWGFKEEKGKKGPKLSDVKKILA
ncbi:hypothetical protein KKG19_00265 [Patescibacteria group bacterium]|nr:hypothetical protein [Patescibacteria group bacterium]